MSLLSTLNNELADVVTHAQRSLVQVRDRRGGAGAGTIWHQDGLIVTNAHVIRRGAVEIALQDGRVYPARVIARDDAHDLAALSIDAHDLPAAEIGSTRALHAGQWVFALGHPWGITNVATGGVVIGLSNHAIEMPDLKNDWVVVDLQLRPGNSGGPLVDSHGRFVGVNTVMTGLSSGMAVSVDAVKRFLRHEMGTPANVV
jgi:serine protease Do